MSKQKHIDSYTLEKSDKILKVVSKYIVEMPFDKIFNDPELHKINSFILKPKRAYANEIKLWTHYINYFIKFYDHDNELLLAYLKIKYMIDNSSNVYKKKNFIEDLYSYILSDSMIEKIEQMTEDNYIINLDEDKKKINNESLQFTNEHGKILMCMSMAMKLFVPLITHYAHVFKVNKKHMDKYLLKCYDGIGACFEGDNDIYNKLYETVTSRMNPTQNLDKGHWKRVEIEGDDPLVQIDNLVNKIYINIIFKYEYGGNIVFLNHASIKRMINNMRRTKSKLNYSPITNQKTDGLSDLDKIEMNNSKFDESLIIMGNINVKQTLDLLCKKYKIKLDDKEIDYYNKELNVKPFQKELIFQFFAKYFGNIQDLYSMNRIQYCILVIIMKRILYAKGFQFMQHILTGNVDFAGGTKKISKKQNLKFKASPGYKYFETKYKDVMDILEMGKILDNYLNIMIFSKIRLVDYELREYTDRLINIKPDVICYELSRFIEPI